MALAAREAVAGGVPVVTVEGEMREREERATVCMQG